MNKGFYGISKNRTYEAPTSASYALTSTSASYALTASYVLNGGSINPTSGYIPYNSGGVFADSNISQSSGYISISGRTDFNTGHANYIRVWDNDEATYQPTTINAAYGSFNINQNSYYDWYDSGKLKYITNGYATRIMMESSQGQILFRVSPSGTAGAQLPEVSALAIKNSGNIGISNDSPSFKLDVSGSGRFTSGILVTGSLIAPTITGSLLGTASYVSGAVFNSTNLALSASYALTASYTRNLQVSGAINNVDYIDFTTIYNTLTPTTPAHKEGRLFYDTGSQTLCMYNGEADVTLNIGQESWLRARNQTGVTITNGSVVRLNSAIGDRPTVVLAQSTDQTNTFSTGNEIIGMATHNIENGTDGFITTFGLVNGLDTSAFTAGDLLWVSQSAGQFTNTAPPVPYDRTFVGIVTRANANNGTVFMTPLTPIHFHDISSVSASRYEQGDLWMYRSGSVGQANAWINTKSLSGSYIITGSLIVTGSTTSTLGFTGSLFGTASWAINFVSASNYVLNSITGSFLTTGSSGVSQTISGSLIINQNLTVLGSSSIQYVTSSQLNIGTNIITVNTATPAVRFGGLAVYDSGSTGTGLTGSILWDSQNNTWLYSNPSGSTYDGAMILVGPRNTSGIGNEIGIAQGYAAVGDGSHHMTSSAIYSSGSLIRLETNTQVTGSLNVSNGLTITGSLAISGSISVLKAGSGSATSFGGSPLTSSVTLTTPFLNNLYSVTMTGEDARIWTVQSKVYGSFVINSNSSIALTGPVYWIATPFNS